MKTIKLPDSWAEITMRQFQELESTESIVEKISILADEDPELIKKIDLKSYKKISEALNWIHTLPEEKECSEIIIDENKYNLIRLSSLSLGSWMDIEHYGKDPVNNLHKLMAIFYRPEGEAEYDSETAIKRAELFLDKMSVNDAYGTLVFFSLIEKKCLTTIKVYFQVQTLIQEMIRKPKLNGLSEKQKKRKQKSGAGSYSPTTWLRETLQRWSHYLN